VSREQELVADGELSENLVSLSRDVGGAHWPVSPPRRSSAMRIPLSALSS